MIKKDISYLILAFSFIFLPFITLLFFLIIYRIDLCSFIPYWNDEVSWYNQIKSVIHYGKPLGYFGYDGNHASYGTFGPWGGAIVVLRAFFGKLFGWNYYSSIFSNAIILSLSQVAFLGFTKPQKKNLLYLILAYCCLFICHLYIVTVMAECTRIALGIFLSGFVYYLFNNKNNYSTKIHILYILGFFIIIGSIFVYLLFSFMLPIYIFLVLQRNVKILKRLWQQVLISGIIGFILIVIIAYIHRKFCAGYGVNSVSLFKNILMHPLKGSMSLMKSGCNNARKVGFSFCFHNNLNDFGFVGAYLLFYYCSLFVVAGTFIVRIQKKDIDTHDIFLYVQILFISIFTLFMSFFFYSNFSEWSFVRGISSSFAILLYLICLTKRNKDSIKVLTLGLLVILPFEKKFTSNLSGRTNTETLAELKKYEKIFDEYIQVNPKGSPWENTIMRCGTTLPIYAALPVGTSTNLMLFNMTVFTEPKYAIFNRNEYEDLRKQYEVSGFSLVYSDDVLYIYENNFYKK